jgi:predicted nucleotidyltransferase
MPIGIWDYVGIKEYSEGLLEGHVDVVNRDGLKPYARPVALADAIHAF